MGRFARTLWSDLWGPAGIVSEWGNAPCMKYIWLDGKDVQQEFRQGRGNVSCLPDTKGKRGIVIACKWYACRLSF
ncbi:hypothetical protein NXW16_21650 [Bacteroides thetaiotaomicron]|nr:hypothetical protein [Bacteroides thetaiotaomicron]